MRPSPALVRQSLAGHGWLGLLVAALMYVVCLTGTLAVFYPEFERWEQPAVPESDRYAIDALERGFNAFLRDSERLTPHMSLYLPIRAFPRARVANENAAWLIDSEGRIGDREAHPFTHLLTDIHLYLTLPHGFGMIVVSSLGALLLALVVSGLLAHPRLVRDAFTFRRGRGDRLEHADLHNRLSVWGTPFFLLIAITGAWFGLILPLVGAASSLTGEPRDAIIASVFGVEPRVTAGGPARLASAFDRLERLAPAARPISVTVHEAHTPARFLEISARQPGRLLWSENYRFAMNGDYLGKVGFSDGAAGKQVAYSMYRLHFGHFDGLRSKVLYGLLGLALTVVAASGVNVWLARRNRRDALDLLWPGLVWGFPLALVLCALATLLAPSIATAGLLWATVGAAGATAVAAGDALRARRWLRSALAAGLALLVAIHLLRHGGSALTGAAAGVNGALLAGALLLGLAAAPRRSSRRSAAPRPA